MDKLIKLELASNFLKPFNKKYGYNEVFKKAWESEFPLLVSVLLMNIVLIALSIMIDSINWVLEIPYWYSCLIRLPLVAFSIVNYQSWHNKGLAMLDISLAIVSLFIPLWSIYLLISLIFRTYLESILLSNY